MKFKTSIRGYSKSQVDKYIAELEQKESNLRNAQKQHIDELADENFALRRKLQTYLSNEQAIAQSLVDANNLAREVQGNAQKFAEVTLERAKTFYVAWNSYAKTLIATLTDEEVLRFNALKDKVERTINAYEGKDVASYAATIAAHMEFADGLSQRADPSNDAPAIRRQSDGSGAADVNTAVFAPKQSGSAAEVGDPSPDEKPSALCKPDNADVGVSDGSDAPTEAEVRAQLKPLAAATEAPSRAQQRAVERLANPIDKVQKASGQAIDLRELIKPTESLADLCRDLGFDVDDSADK